MTDAAPTAPIRYGAPEPAPNKPTECARCGSPAISARGVALHDADHAERDKAAKRQATLLGRLEVLLDSIETNIDPATGKRLTLGAWIHQTDDLLDTLEHATDPDGDGWIRKALAEIAERLEKPSAEPAGDAEILPWPGNPWTPDEDETIEPDEDDRDPDEIIPSSATHSFPGDPTGIAAAPDLEDALAGEPAESGADDLEPNPWGAR